MFKNFLFYHRKALNPILLGWNLNRRRIGIMKELWTLFLTFCRIGGLTFGGGYAMLPMLQKEVVEKYGWATEEELMDYYAVGQCTPGIIAVNTATFIGYRRKGILGAICATAGVVFPSLVIIVIIAAFLSNFQDNLYVQHAFAGIRVAVCVLVADTVVKLAKKSVKGWVGISLFLITLVLMVIWNPSPVWFVLAGAVLGMLLGKVGVLKK